MKEVWAQIGLVSGHEIATQTPPYGLLTKEGLLSTSQAATQTGLLPGVDESSQTLTGSGGFNLTGVARVRYLKQIAAGQRAKAAKRNRDKEARKLES